MELKPTNCIFSDEVERQDSMDHLKNVLENYSVTMSTSPRTRKKLYATGRQQSLPAHLDAVDEGDESKGRSPSLSEYSEEIISSLSSSKESIGSNDKHFFELPDSSKKQRYGKIGDSESSRPESRQESESSYYPSSLVFSTDENDRLLDVDFNADETGISKYSENILDTRLNLKAGSSDALCVMDHTPSTSSHTSESEMNSSDPVSRPKLLFEVPSTIIPTIVVTPNRLITQSSTSLELSEILKTEDERVEPALLSVVLSDVEDNMSTVSSGGGSILGQSSKSNSLSPCNLSVSPIPISPVTVIELDKLDNQNDSIDSLEYNEAPSHTAKLKNNFNETNTLPQINSENQVFQMSITEAPELNEKLMHDNFHERSRMSSKDCSSEADDGRLSPLLIFSNRSFEQSPASSPGSAFEARYSITKEESGISTSEVGVQQDDGSLSPLLLLDDWDKLDELDSTTWPTQLCIVRNETSQTDMSYVTSTRTIETQTDFMLSYGESVESEPDCFVMTSGTQTNLLDAPLSNLCSQCLCNYNRSTSNGDKELIHQTDSCDSGPSSWTSNLKDGLDISQLIVPSNIHDDDRSSATSEYYMALESMDEPLINLEEETKLNDMYENENVSACGNIFTGDKTLMNRYIRQVANRKQCVRSSSLEIRRARKFSDTDESPQQANIIRRNQSLEARRRSSLQRQKSFEEWTATIRELEGEIDEANEESEDQSKLDSKPSEESDSAFDIPSVAVTPGNSTEKDDLAASIVTDLFSIIKVNPTKNNDELLNDIDKDYRKTTASTSKDSLFSFQLTDSSSSSFDVVNPTPYTQHLAPGIRPKIEPLLPQKFNHQLLAAPSLFARHMSKRRGSDRTYNSCNTSCTSSLTSSFDDVGSSSMENNSLIDISFKCKAADSIAHNKVLNDEVHFGDQGSHSSDHNHCDAASVWSLP